MEADDHAIPSALSQLIVRCLRISMWPWESLITGPPRRYPGCNRLAVDPPDVEASERAMNAFFRLHGVIDIRAFLTGWFRGAPFEVSSSDARSM